MYAEAAKIEKQEVQVQMGSYLNPSVRSFEMALNSRIFIDKSGLIEITNQSMNSLQRFICVSRPRRFGKSMAMDMLAAYYGKGSDTDRLFCNLKIGKTESYKKCLNQYEVLKINMQDFLSATNSMDEMLGMFSKYLIYDLLDDYQEVRFRDENNLIQVMKDVYAHTQLS